MSVSDAARKLVIAAISRKASWNVMTCRVGAAGWFPKKYFVALPDVLTRCEQVEGLSLLHVEVLTKQLPHHKYITNLETLEDISYIPPGRCTSNIFQT